MAQGITYGLDVGTTKIVAIAGRADGRRRWSEVLSMGEAPSHGLKRGVVVDREAAADSIARALDSCGVHGVRVNVGIAGSHISSFNTEVTLLNRGRDLTITDRFVRKLETEARQVDLHEDERIIHVIPRGYVLDGAEGVRQPIGLAARKVTMRAHIVTGAVSSIQNLLSAVEDAGARVGQIVLEPLASAEACLLDEDRDGGVVLLDIGGGTTDVAAFLKGNLTHTAVIPLGGQSFTSDLSYGLKVPAEDAEALKRRYGTVISSAVDSVAAVPYNGRHYNANFMSRILEHRAREVFELARETLESNHLGNLLPEGVVLTGGGSLLDGMTELAETTLRMRARAAMPRRVRGNLKPVQQPQYATAVGLLYFAPTRYDRGPKSKGAGATSFGSIVEAVKGWFMGGRTGSRIER